MIQNLLVKTHLSAKALLSKVRSVFDQVREPVKGTQGKNKTITITDCLMSALAIFKLKVASLLQFEKNKAEKPIKENLEKLFQVNKIPSDTYMRERLDEIDPKEIRPAFKAVFAALQRDKVLENYVFLNGKYLLLSDGTGFFSSKQVSCENCCQKHHKKDGSTTYYHQMLGAAIVHPDYKEVIPLCPEPIMQKDGFTKNDCERNASERFINDFRREHPHLSVILVEDALSANGPHLKLLKESNISFITVAKPGSNKALFEELKCLDESENGLDHHCFIDADGIKHEFKYVNQIPINDTHIDFEVNFLEYKTTDSEGKQLYYNTWITDIEITRDNIFTIAKGGRSRWFIENEVFNTLKNQGTHFEHNFGHGYRHLSTVFSMLMVLAFLIDQAEQIACPLFRAALKRFKGKKSYLWRRIRAFFSTHIIPSWEILYRVIISGNNRTVAILDTS